MSGHPLHGTKPLAASLRVAVAMPASKGRQDIQLYKIQFTERPIQGREAAEKRAQQIKELTGTEPLISRL